jgi:hypothetical protein
MDHIRILKRAFSITTSYRALWIFGILLALTTGGRVSGSGGGGGGGGTGSGTFPRPEISPDVLTGLIVAGVVFLCVTLLLAVAAVIARYVAETALIRMVDQHEVTGVKISVRQGFRLGWSRAALRLFLMDLVLGLSLVIAFLLLLLLAASPLLVWLTDSTPLRLLGTVLAGALGVVIIFVAIVAGIALSLLLQLWHRAVVLEDRNVNAAVRRGWHLLRQRLGDVVVMGLILFALGLAWTIVMVPVFFLLVAVAAIGGGLPALLVYAVASLIAQGATPWIAAVIVGLPIFIVIMAIPLAVLGGLVQTFQSSTWTLTYRELLALEAARPAPGGDQPLAPLPAA